MALIHWVASLFLPEKLAGRAAFSSEVCEDMTGGTVGAGGVEPTVGMGSGQVCHCKNFFGWEQKSISRVGLTMTMNGLGCSLRLSHVCTGSS